MKWKKLCNTFMFFTCFLMLCLLTKSVSATSGWSMGGYTKTEEDVYILTEKYVPGCLGKLVKNSPVDTRNGFSISFDYWVGDVDRSAREGFQVEFTDQKNTLIDEDFYIYPDSTYRAVFFSSYRNEGIHLEQNDKQYITTLQIKKIIVSDNTWHNVIIEYQGGNVTVTRDGELIISQKGYYFPDMAYVGFRAFTSYFGTQTTKIRNIDMKASEASLVTFHPQGGSVSPSQAYILRNSKGTLPTPVKYGNTFLGWYTSPTGGVRVRSTNYNFASHQILYAHWKDNTVKVKFNANKGTVSRNVKAVLPKSKVGTLPVPVRKKYTFLGWYTKKSGGDKITSSTVIRKNMTVYAHWVLSSKKIKINLNKNGGSCKKSSITATCGGTLKNLPTATRKGYRFLGWYTKKNGGTKVYASTKTTNLLTTKKLYAHWSRISSGSGTGSTGSGSSGNRGICAICHGSRRCNRCGGTGYIYNYVTGKYNRNCTRCNTSGRCIYCR